MFPVNYNWWKDFCWWNYDVSMTYVNEKADMTSSPDDADISRTMPSSFETQFERGGIYQNNTSEAREIRTCLALLPACGWGHRGRLSCHHDGLHCERKDPSLFWKAAFAKAAEPGVPSSALSVTICLAIIVPLDSGGTMIFLSNSVAFYRVGIRRFD